MTVKKQVTAKKSWGAAKVEILALAPEIQNLYAENKNLTSIFKILFEQKKITIGERTFRRHAAKIVKDSSISAPPLDNQKNTSIQKTTSNNKNKVFEIIEPVFEHSNSLSSDEDTKKTWDQS